jgi:phosphatidylglycerol:prolipoprotein diacylglycerol transferase
MLIHPQIDPVALQIGPLAIHWYGLTYLAAFGLFLWLGLRRLRHEPFASITGPGAWRRADVEDILFLGVGRGHRRAPGLLPVLQAGLLRHPSAGDLRRVARRHELSRRHAGRDGGHGCGSPVRGTARSCRWDFVAPCMPTGLAAGRVGNFINGELWGRIADPSLPWAMVFRGAGSTPRVTRRRSTSS